MPNILPGLALLALLLIPATSAEAAGGIGVNLRGHVHNIPHAVASGRNLNVGGGSGATSPSRSISTTRGIQSDRAGEAGTINQPR